MGFLARDRGTVVHDFNWESVAWSPTKPFFAGALINEQKANTTDAVIRAMAVALHVGIRDYDKINTFDIKDFSNCRVGELKAGEMRNILHKMTGKAWRAVNGKNHLLEEWINTSSCGLGLWFALRGGYVDQNYEAAGIHWIGTNGKMVFDPNENETNEGCEFPLVDSQLAESFLVQALVVAF
jgi:hypothetical protein